MTPYRTLEAAEAALATAEQDVRGDMGDEAWEQGASDIVKAIGALCAPSVRAELYRREGVES